MRCVPPQAPSPATHRADVGRACPSARGTRARFADIVTSRTPLPFTPFHLGAALIAKPALDQRLSLTAFALAQVAMDVEPGVRMLTGADEVLHGLSHTLPGAVVIAAAVALVTPMMRGPVVRRWNREARFYQQHWLIQPEALTRGTVAAGALFGTLSHVGLDSLIHQDIRPLFPFSAANPLQGLLSHDAVYLACAVAAGIGAIAWLAVRWRAGRSRA